MNAIFAFQNCFPSNCLFLYLLDALTVREYCKRLFEFEEEQKVRFKSLKNKFRYIRTMKKMTREMTMMVRSFPFFKVCEFKSNDCFPEVRKTQLFRSKMAACSQSEKAK